MAQSLHSLTIPDSPRQKNMNPLSRFKKCKDAVQRKNNFKNDWTDIFAMRQTSMNFTIKQMQREAQQMRRKERLESAEKQ